MRFLSILTISFLLSSCSSLRHQQNKIPELIAPTTTENLTDWRITGRISLRTPQETNIVSIRWQQKEDDIQLRLYGSMGKTYARLVSKDGLSTLTVDNKTYTDPNARYLFWKVLGWDLPIGEMSYWIKGINHPAKLEQQLTRNSKGQLISFNYKQWSVEYDKYKKFEDLYLPVKLKLTHPKLRIRFSIQNWKVSENG